MMRQRVPFVVVGGLSERITMMGAPTFRWRMCGGMPDISRELRNSTGYCTASSSVIALSMLMYWTASPGKSSVKALLILFTVSLRGARMARSDSTLGRMHVRASLGR